MDISSLFRKFVHYIRALASYYNSNATENGEHEDAALGLRILKLPQELQDIILDFALELDDDPVVVGTGWCRSPPWQLQVNRRTRTELRKVYYGTKHFIHYLSNSDIQGFFGFKPTTQFRRYGYAPASTDSRMFGPIVECRTRGPSSDLTKWLDTVNTLGNTALITRWLLLHDNEDKPFDRDSLCRARSYRILYPSILHQFGIQEDHCNFDIIFRVKGADGTPFDMYMDEEFLDTPAGLEPEEYMTRYLAHQRDLQERLEQAEAQEQQDIYGMTLEQ